MRWGIPKEANTVMFSPIRIHFLNNDLHWFRMHQTDIKLFRDIRIQSDSKRFSIYFQICLHIASCTGDYKSLTWCTRYRLLKIASDNEFVPFDFCLNCHNILQNSAIDKVYNKIFSEKVIALVRLKSPFKTCLLCRWAGLSRSPWPDSFLFRDGVYQDIEPAIIEHGKETSWVQQRRVHHGKSGSRSTTEVAITGFCHWGLEVVETGDGEAIRSFESFSRGGKFTKLLTPLNRFHTILVLYRHTNNKSQTFWRCFTKVIPSKNLRPCRFFQNQPQNLLNTS